MAGINVWSVLTNALLVIVENVLVSCVNEIFGIREHNSTVWLPKCSVIELIVAVDQRRSAIDLDWSTAKINSSTPHFDVRSVQVNQLKIPSARAGSNNSFRVFIPLQCCADPREPSHKFARAKDCRQK